MNDYYFSHYSPGKSLWWETLIKWVFAATLVGAFAWGLFFLASRTDKNAPPPVKYKVTVVLNTDEESVRVYHNVTRMSHWTSHSFFTDENGHGVELRNVPFIYEEESVVAAEKNVR